MTGTELALLVKHNSPTLSHKEAAEASVIFFMKKITLNETSAISYLQLYTLNYTQYFYHKLSFRHRDRTTSYLQGEVAKKQLNIIPIPISKTTRQFYHSQGMLVPHSSCGLPLTMGLRSRTLAR